MAKFRQVQSSFAYGVLSEEAASRTDLDFVKQGCSELTNFVVEPIGGIRKRIGCELTKTLTLPALDGDDVILDILDFIPIKGSDRYLVITLRAKSYYLQSTYSVISIVDSNLNYLSDVTFFSGFTDTSYFDFKATSSIASIIQLGDIFVCARNTNEPLIIFPDNIETGTYHALSLARYLTKLALTKEDRKLLYQYYPFKEWNLDRNATIQASATTGLTKLIYKKNGTEFPFFKFTSNRNYLIAANYLDTTWKKALWETDGAARNGWLSFSRGASSWSETSGNTVKTVTSILGTISASTCADTYLQVGRKVFVSYNGVSYTVSKEWNGAALPCSEGETFTIQDLNVSSIDVFTVIDPPNTNTTYSWSIPEWNPMDGYPTKVSFVGTRMCFAGAEKDTEAIWLSAANNILKFNNLRFKIDETATSSEVGVYGALGDTDAHKTRATSAQFNRTSWILNADELTVGCQGGIFILNRSTTGDFLPLKTTSSAISYDSAANINPTMMEFGIVFVDASKKGLKFLDFRSEKKGINDISLLVSGKFTNISQILYQRSTKTLFVLDSGKLFSFTLSTFTNVAGFAEHTLPNSVDISRISLTADDELIVILKNGSQPNVKIGVATFKSSSTYLDFYGSYSSLTNITDWSTSSDKFKILGSLTVPCLVDGVETTGTFNSDGSLFTSAIEGKALTIGYPFTARMTTLSLDPGGVLGSAVGALKRPDEVVLKVKNTQNMKVGGKTLYTSKSTLVPYSGDISEKVAADPSTDSRITVESSGNYPCHILSMTFKGFTQE